MLGRIASKWAYIYEKENPDSRTRHGAVTAYGMISGGVHRFSSRFRNGWGCATFLDARGNVNILIPEMK